MYGGLIDRLHDLLLCGVDPSMVDLSTCLEHLKSNDKSTGQHVYRETKSLLKAASLPWTPSHHAFLYGPKFKACIASVSLVKVRFLFTSCVPVNFLSLDFLFNIPFVFSTSALDPFVSSWVLWWYSPPVSPL